MSDKKIIFPGDPDFKYIDNEEKDLIDSIENNTTQFISVTDKKELSKYKDVARQFNKKRRKNKSITLRISEKDYDDIKEIAQEEGLPYQTLITSILHKYIKGTLNI